MTDLSPNTMISLSMWNSAIAGVRFPQYKYSWRSTFTNGGALDAYRIAGNSFILGSIEDNLTRYNDYRDTRSNYMSRSYTNILGTWTTADNFTNLLNVYSYTGNRSARLLMNRIAGTISTLNTSVYLIYADLIINSVNAQNYLEMQLLKNGSLVSSAYEAVPSAGHSAWVQTSALSLYETSTYSLRFRFNGTGTVTVRLGYSEFIGNKNRCGALS